MRRWSRWFAILAVAAILPGGLSGLSTRAQSAAGRPNVVLIVLDDLRHGDFVAMPNVRRLLVDRGTTFSRAYVTDPICCPSRASILRGQYVHNHGVPTIAAGSKAFRRSGSEASTLGTWLKGNGYRTGFVGKYFVSYPDDAPPTYVPPGWTSWVADLQGGYVNYRLNVNRRVLAFKDRPRAYRTDVEGLYARAFLNDAMARGGPFFLYVTPKAPHSPALPAPRHLRAPVREAKAPRVPSFNEADVSDKPAYLRRLPRFTGQKVVALDRYHIARQRTLLSADVAIASLLGSLQAAGKLDNTYVIVTSDNGYLLGEHRVEGKGFPYENSIGVPFVVRGPGVAAGATDDRLVTLADLAPTIAELSETAVPAFVDGRSIAPLLRGEAPPAPWRSAVLVEYVDQFNGRANPPTHRYALAPSWSAIRTADRLYVEYVTGERELYDTATDRHQLSNLAGTRPEEQAALAERLAALKACAGDGCRAAENGAAPLLPEPDPSVPPPDESG